LFQIELTCLIIKAVKRKNGHHSVDGIPDVTTHGMLRFRKKLPQPCQFEWMFI